MVSDFDSVLAAVKAMSPADRAKWERDLQGALNNQIWVPNPGPQTDAYYCEADELLYGGTAGCGKTGLGCGLSLTQHRRTLFLRRTNKEASKIFDAYFELLGTREGWNGQDSYWRLPDGRVIDVGGCQLEDDKQKWKGNPHDLIFFDELCDFTETQYKFIKTWNRSADPGQRCRVVSATNPPTRPEGMWIVRYWAPWLDPRHPNPARPSELRWFLDDKEVDGPGPHLLDGRPTRASSRTFIPGKLADNPDLAQSNYDSVLASLPAELRAAYREGRFDVAIKDDAFQTIPSEWIMAAFERWKDHPRPPEGVPMSAISVDIAMRLGSETSTGAYENDSTVIQWRHGGWYAEPVMKSGAETKTGAIIAGLVVAYRRDEAQIIVDMGGGYGGGTWETMVNNGLSPYSFRGLDASSARTRDGQFKFINRRTEAYWKFREALDPDQPGGSPIALPENRDLLLDLVTPKWALTANGIQITPKIDVIKALGRSPDRGDAVVTCWLQGMKVYNAMPIGYDAAEHGLRKKSNIVDLGPRRAASIVRTRR